MRKKELCELDPKMEELLLKLLENNEVGERNLKAKRHLENKFFRNTIYSKYNNGCFKCGTDGRGVYVTKAGKVRRNHLSIHHKSYDWDCSQSDRKRFDCELCSTKDKELFDICVNNCVLLCDICHCAHHYQLKFQKGDWIKKDDNDELLSKKIDINKFKKKKIPIPKTNSPIILSDNEKIIFNKIKEYRLLKAKEKKLPAYCILNDKTLFNISKVKPLCKSDLINVKGFGENKFNLYGEDILEIIKNC